MWDGGCCSSGGDTRVCSLLATVALQFPGRHTPCFQQQPNVPTLMGKGGSGEWGAAAACCPHQAPLRIFHPGFTSLDTTGKLQEWRSNLSLLASAGSLLFPSPSLGLPHTRTEENSSVSLLDKRDLSSRVEMARAA